MELKTRRSRRAQSLVEVLVGTGLLMLVILPIMGLMGRSTRSTGQLTRHLAARSAAEAMLDEVASWSPEERGGIDPAGDPRIARLVKDLDLPKDMCAHVRTEPAVGSGPETGSFTWVIAEVTWSKQPSGGILSLERLLPAGDTGTTVAD